MRTFATHQQRVAFVAALMDLFWRGYECDPLDMAERAALDDATFAIYRMGVEAGRKDGECIGEAGNGITEENNNLPRARARV